MALAFSGVGLHPSLELAGRTARSGGVAARATTAVRPERSFRVAGAATIGIAVAARAARRGHRSRRGRTCRAATSLPGAIVEWAGESTEEEDDRLTQAVVDAVRAAREDAAVWSSVEDSAMRALDSLEERLKSENRTLRELLGEDAAKSAEEALAVGLREGLSREEDLRAALRTKAVERAIGALLKDGIFEFLQTVDLLGQTINRLPILGPMRRQLIEGARKEVDRILGAQIDAFLGRYTRLAAERTLLPFLTSAANSAALSQSAQELARYVLDRKVSDVMPEEKVAASLRGEIMMAMKSVSLEAVGEGVEGVRRLMHKRPDIEKGSGQRAAVGPLADELDTQWRRFLGDKGSTAPPCEQAARAGDAAASAALEKLPALDEEAKKRLGEKFAALLQEEMEVSGVVDLVQA